MSRILGLQIDAFDLKKAVSAIKSMLETTETDHIVTVNPEFLVKAEKDPEFKQLLREASFRTADGVGVSVFSKVSLKRASGVDLMLALAEELEGSSFSFFLFGAKKGIAKKTAEELQAQFPDLSIAGTLDGTKAFAPSNLEVINAASPDLLFVALGAGKQERWIAKHENKLPSCKIAIGVGGAFDILSDTKSRAPKLFRRLGLEWLWRLILEPNRAPRIYRAVFYFPYLVFKKRLAQFIASFNGNNQSSKDK